MMKQILIFSILFAISITPQGQPIGSGDADVTVEKQRLVKFPDEVDQLQGSTGNNSEKSNAKMHEAQRILKEIEKINNALGYIRKQTEQSKLPAILDSSQYLFPKPLMQPFHQQYHQTTDLNGETILLPSIRSVRLDQQYILPYSDFKATQFNRPPLKQQKVKKDNTSHNTLFFRPSLVVIPSSHGSSERQQLTTHFVIPVRLYELNKEEYINKNTPQEFYVKGYKIVGDIDNLYWKTKQKKQEKYAKLKPKYHLFFLPREVALNEDSKHAISQTTQIKFVEKGDANIINSREKKVIGIQRPYKIQTTATSSSSGGGSSSNVTTQIIRKRVIPKPLREKEPSTSEQAEQQLPIGGISAEATHPNTNTNINMNSNLIGKPSMNNPTHSSNNFNSRPGALSIQNVVSTIARPNDPKNTTAANAIKTAFQNIFKFPFRQDNKPDGSSNVSGQMPQTVPYITTQTYRPVQPFYEVIGDQPPQKVSDYQWEDETSNSASEADETDNSTVHMEKQIFGHRHTAEQQTQMEAVKQGGIIIQRLKVRKGGIAIAGPGGVATAGSGGTAIVGPGGYALTHPRSLTIAGPGAKIIAIPSNVDLKDALQRTNPSDQSIPREGKLVATGPTVYYSPATGMDSTSHIYND